MQRDNCATFCGFLILMTLLNTVWLQTNSCWKGGQLSTYSIHIRLSKQQFCCSLITTALHIWTHLY